MTSWLFGMALQSNVVRLENDLKQCNSKHEAIQKQYDELKKAFDKYREKFPKDEK